VNATVVNQGRERLRSASIFLPAATLSLPIAAKQSVQFVSSTGVTTRRGWDFNSFNVTWQFVSF
jgi:hypothetical protein